MEIPFDKDEHWVWKVGEVIIFIIVIILIILI